MTWRIEIVNRTGVVDAVGDGIRDDITDLGIGQVEQVRFARLYALDGDLSAEEVNLVADALLADPVTQDFYCTSDKSLKVAAGQWGVEVWFRTGVTDAVGETALKGIKDLGVQGITGAATGRGYIITGALDKNSIETICRRLLANDVIEQYQYYTGD